MAPTSPSDFTLFSFLPPELRLHIWRLSCQGRVVEIHYSERSDRCLSASSPPTILHVNRESRDEGLRLYVLAFGTRSAPDAHYFSPALDVLYVPRSPGGVGYGNAARDFAHVVGPHTARLVHRLAIDHVAPEIRRPWETYNKFCLMRAFPALEEVYLVLTTTAAAEKRGQEGQRGRHRGHVEFVDPRGDMEAIMKLMHNVRESFTYEVGEPVRLAREEGSVGARKEEDGERDIDNVYRVYVALDMAIDRAWDDGAVPSDA
ncbi:hypothetical protein P8C59_001339 [Phyllachora maydis]|uniref:2EXR domain-containing protein n=1 Tax=Phyllachora maydis TaxID=1825666 RepID=A0AAD9HY71_9PEZI|nr:hypothetical protein P8C59_001339 [Phyllachora maydis]